MTTEYVAGRSQSDEGPIYMRRALRLCLWSVVFLEATRILTIGIIGCYEGIIDVKNQTAKIENFEIEELETILNYLCTS